MPGGGDNIRRCKQTVMPHPVLVVPTSRLCVKRADHFQDDPGVFLLQLQHRLRREHVHTLRAAADEVCITFADQVFDRIPQTGLELDTARIGLVITKWHLTGAVPRESAFVPMMRAVCTTSYPSRAVSKSS